MPSAAPENKLHFLGRLMASTAPKDLFLGAGQLLQYPAPFVGVGYIYTRPWKKRGIAENHFCSSAHLIRD